MFVQKTIHETRSTEETEALARRLSSGFRGQKIFLFGNLGAGKTTFTRALATAYGVYEIKSPTFVYEHAHSLADGSNLYHLDLYRLENGVSPIFAERLREIFVEPAATVVVEWSERLPPELLPLSRVEIRFTETADGGRRIEVTEAR